jgi:hypothetical protein
MKTVNLARKIYDGLGELAEWRATHVMCEPRSCLSRFSCQSRLSQASTTAVEAPMSNAG